MAKKTKKKAAKSARAGGKGKKTAVKKSTTRSSFGVVPLADRIVVRPLEAETVTASGIIIPETVEKERPERGTVVAVGEGKYDDGVLVKPRVAVGDVVIFSKYGYDEVKVHGVEYLIVREDSILAIVT